MNNSDLEFPEIPSLMRRTDWCEAFRDFARATYKLNAKPGIEAIQVLLQKGYEFKDGVWLEPVKSSEPGKFDLEAAKRGEPIQTRMGRKATFVGYAEGAEPQSRVICHIEGNDRCCAFDDEGVFKHGFRADDDLFMQPKPKKTVYVNVWEPYMGAKELGSSASVTAIEAQDRAAHAGGPYLLIAHPIEIEVK